MENVFNGNKLPNTQNVIGKEEYEVQTSTIVFSDEEDGEENADFEEYTMSCNFESEDEDESNVSFVLTN